MPVRLKKLIGTVLLVLLIAVYALLATMIAVAHLGQSSVWVQLAYFFFTGFLWILPAMSRLWRMVQPPNAR